MDSRFSRQLAGLRRAASRAGRGGGEGGNDRNGGDRPQGGRGGGNHNRCHNDGGDARRGGYRGDDRDRRRDDGRNDRYRDRDDCRPRKRGRNDHEHDRGRGGSFRRSGRGGGGNNQDCGYDNDFRHGRRDTWGRDGKNNSSELVKQVAEKYKASRVINPVDAAGTGKKRRHIALLFLTISDLPHEHIWKEWVRSSSTDDDDDDGDGKTRSDEDVTVSVLCHAKFPERIRSPWLRRRHLLQRQCAGETNVPKFHSRRPEWGSIEITRAMIDLLEEGLRVGGPDGGDRARYLAAPAGASKKDASCETDGLKLSARAMLAETDMPPVDRFVFASESCLPVVTLREAELALFGPRNAPEKACLYEKSWVNARSTSNNGYAKQLQWDTIHPSDIPPSFVWKADQWMALTRSHAEAVISLPSKYLGGRELWPSFRKVRASDEIYFPTALSVLGILHRPRGGGEVDDSSKKESCAGDEVRRRRVTYCDWSVGAKSPASFTRKEWRGVVKKARGQGCLIARKFVVTSAAAARGREKDSGPAKGSDGDVPVSVEEWVSAVVRREGA